jgi:hypothetical protein
MTSPYIARPPRSLPQVLRELIENAAAELDRTSDCAARARIRETIRRLQTTLREAERPN